MSAMILQWRQAPAPLDLSWRGPTGEMMAAVARDPMATIAAVIGPPGGAATAGDGIDIVGSEVRVVISDLPTAP